jgi:hypothetical protein
MNFELTNQILNEEDIHNNVLTQHLGQSIADENSEVVVKYIKGYLETMAMSSRWNADNERAWEILKEHELI